MAPSGIVTSLRCTGSTMVQRASGCGPILVGSMPTFLRDEPRSGNCGSSSGERGGERGRLRRSAPLPGLVATGGLPGAGGTREGRQASAAVSAAGWARRLGAPEPGAASWRHDAVVAGAVRPAAAAIAAAAMAWRSAGFGGSARQECLRPAVPWSSAMATLGPLSATGCSSRPGVLHGEGVRDSVRRRLRGRSIGHRRRLGGSHRRRLGRRRRRSSMPTRQASSRLRVSQSAQALAAPRPARRPFGAGSLGKCGRGTGQRNVRLGQRRRRPTAQAIGGARGQRRAAEQKIERRRATLADPACIHPGREQPARRAGRGGRTNRGDAWGLAVRASPVIPCSDR